MNGLKKSILNARLHINNIGRNWKHSGKFVRFLVKHIIDILFIAAIITILVLETNVFPKEDWYYSFCSWFGIKVGHTDFAYREGIFYINTLIVTLFPLLDTIFGISISVSHQEIYGVRYKEFRNIYGLNLYNLTGIILISICLFCLAIVYYYFCFIFSAILIACIALVYMVIFVLIEVPILTRSKFVIDSALSSAYAILFKESNSQKQGRKNAETMVIYSFKDRGFMETCNFFLRQEENISDIFSNMFWLMSETVKGFHKYVSDSGTITISDFFLDINLYLDYFEKHKKDGYRVSEKEQVNLGNLIADMKDYFVNIVPNDIYNNEYNKVIEKLGKI